MLPSGYYILDMKNMVLNSVGGYHLASYQPHDINLYYKFPKPKKHLDSWFYENSSYLNTKEVIKSWRQEPTKFF